ncbi:MAG: zinc metallopeptidase [Planctomycetes bacterium]|nr:zinc metallopeptidase [Planctomycetota bacterium]
MIIDPLYLLCLAPGVLLAVWAQWRVSSAYHRAQRVPAASGASGAETAAHILHAAGVRTVDIEPVPGQLTDHYSPGEKVLRLSTDVYDGRSLAALGIAAHEAGHALQDAKRYPLLVLRNGLVPLANFGGSVGWLMIAAGLVLAVSGLVWAGIAVFSATVLFQLVNLPVEFDASRRARAELLATGLIARGEEREVARVLNAAALTYVAATLTSILTLVYFVFRAGHSNDE